MSSDTPAQRPEGQLIEEAAKTDGRPVRKLAPLAGLSEGRWRQIVKGWMSSGGHLVEVIAPAATLARMAHVLEVSPEQLAAAGRADAAELLENGAIPDNAVVDHVFPQQPHIRIAWEGGTHGQISEEIELIYRSAMTPEQKLRAIRMVLDLAAQVEQERIRAAHRDARNQVDNLAPAQDAGAKE